MAALRDLSLLQKCEDFLLHPTVRALSLAQRVDFLEKKGLSPEEITQCLKSVERRNGLSQLAHRTAEGLVEMKPSGSEVAASASPFQLLQFVVKKYGLVTLLLALLGYGYAQFRRRKTQQLLLQHEADKTQRQKRMHLRVEALLAVVKDQQAQYNQAAGLLRARVSKYLAAQQAATKQPKASASATQFTRGLELQALQSELMELKCTVLDTYLEPRVVNKVVEVTKEIPIILRPAETQGMEESTEQVASGKVVATSRKSTKKHHQTVPDASQRESRAEKQSGIRDQTEMSSEEIAELFERGQVEEELSTAGSYRVLFATQ
ncbi:Peroxisome membrane anchor protein Pex14p, N-terminal [Phytophthora cactorum]|nr:Peroxisome membrane anchor protein Pex14p, N-terminal [Phytophthora cactorum]